ncbi:MAG: SPASM domain-containing protein [Bdellovibrionales bacterium]
MASSNPEPMDSLAEDSYEVRRAKMLERNKGRVCLTPFERLDVWPDGSAVQCCTDWMVGTPIIGNIEKQPMEEIWNSPVAKEIRKSVVDGTFSRCTERCPVLAAGTLCKIEDVPPHLKEAVAAPLEDMKIRPAFIKVVNDYSCNLQCPSCRDKVFVTNHARSEEIAAANMRNIYPLLETARALDILGNGEALVSRASMRLLQAIDPVLHKNLTIQLLTNGTLFTPKAWERLKNLHSLNIRLYVSTDGVTKATYEKLRRGGKWEVFNDNLAFIARLRREEQINHLMLNFTVQASNFRELPLFGEFAARYNADRVVLFRLSPWPHMAKELFDAENIFDPAHPDHAEFLDVVRGFEGHPLVEIGPLAPFR